MAKDKAAQRLGKRGGKKRWQHIAAGERTAIMRRVIQARWDRGKGNPK